MTGMRYVKCGGVVSVGLACALVGYAITPADFRYVARPAISFEYHGEPDMRLPTAVTVGADGTVYVVDGVRDRVVVFAPDGQFREEIRAVQERALKRPLGAKVDRGGVLWIADTGNRRILARGPDRSLVREIAYPIPASGGGEPVIADVAVSEDGRTVWLSDNHHHNLAAFDVASETFRVVGEIGEALGQLYHPFLLAAGRDGEVLVSEPVSGRVQVFSAAGEPVRALGSFGVDIGNLYRPKGVAVDRDGSAWIADGTLGVIQIFAPTGEVLDVLRDAAGAPLKLNQPCGIALDGDGNLYVAELTADRVQKFVIDVNPQAPVQLPAAPPPGGLVQPRACTVCHLEWVGPLNRGEGTVLASPPLPPPDQPFVSKSTTCLSCHDGSVIDSRQLIWVEHGHRTGLEPPPTMRVPATLPLVEGRVMCRTCHSAHGPWQGSGAMATAIFLRVPNPGGELCMSCHADMTGGPQAGMHPTTGMPGPVPEVLIEAGARTGPNPRQLTCQVCHRAHGAVHEYLLVLGVESNQLCLACHEPMRPGMFRAGGEAEHPLSPVVNAAQAAAVEDMGTLLGPGERLICLSCHRLHHGRGEQFLLADDLTDGQMCLRCHEDRRALVQTAHDLRTNFPEERDRLGLTAHTGGPCSACHLFHEYARAWEESPIDPGGRCITCHERGRIAEAALVGTVNHPPIGCTNCHDPHTQAYRPFLRYIPHAMCTSCHVQQSRLLDGLHDVACTPAAWPEVSATMQDACLACHRPHGSEQTGLFRVGYAPGEERADGPCVACHPDVARDASTTRTLLHPRQARPTDTAPTDAKRELISCPKCHDPHSGSGVTARFIRVPPQADLQELCLNCHPDAANIRVIGHAVSALRAAGIDARLCTPCHNPHGLPAAYEPELMWPRELSATSQPVRVANRHCLACHRAGGPAPEPTVATHPTVDMFNSTPPGAPGYLPLFNDAGEIDPRGTIACRTCHLTHGRPDATPAPPGTGQTAARELRARRWHLRALEPGNVCATCHGFDALRRFIYFHNPLRRGGPLPAPSGP